MLLAGFYILDQFCFEEVSVSFLNCYCSAIILKGLLIFHSQFQCNQIIRNKTLSFQTFVKLNIFHIGFFVLGELTGKKTAAVASQEDYSYCN